MAGIERTFAFEGVCGIPITAAAVSINVAVTQPTAAGNVRLYPAGSPVPNSSTINYRAGQTRTNNTIVGLSAGGELAALNQPAGTTHLIIDVNGYFEPAPVCGNGILEAGEVCDDGNTFPGDGCSDLCQLEDGWTCEGSPSVCTTTCGDGLPAGIEQCDDGNSMSGDGCSAACTVEPGFNCAGAPSVCTTTCGDGLVAGAEQCDDGNALPGDGCAAACMVEEGWMCAGSPSVCSTVCGDGIVAGSEECDDGNTTDGDGCSSTCQVEAPVCLDADLDGFTTCAGDCCDSDIRAKPGQTQFFTTPTACGGYDFNCDSNPTPQFPAVSGGPLACFGSPPCIADVGVGWVVSPAPGCGLPAGGALYRDCNTANCSTFTQTRVQSCR